MPQERTFPMNRLKFVSLMLAASLLGMFVLGCASQTATPLAIEAQTNGLVYYVASHGKDERGLKIVIGDALRTRGLRVQTGPQGGQPDDTTYLV